MTWAEFKQAVKAAGIRDEDDIAYIDGSWYGTGTVGAYVLSVRADGRWQVAIDDSAEKVERSRAASSRTKDT